MSITASFHLSFEVSDYNVSQIFYTQILGGKILVDNGRWCNIDFYGHQITLHHNPNLILRDLSNFHWGLNMSWTDFEIVCNRLISVEAPFIKVPEVQNKGTKNERVKMVFRDPDGYILEFKVFKV